MFDLAKNSKKYKSKARQISITYIGGGRVGYPASRRNILTDEDLQFAITNPDNPSSLVSKAPPRIKSIVLRVAGLIASNNQKQEFTLNQQTQPTERDMRLRLNFWDEYNYATACNLPMRMSAILQTTMPLEDWIGFYESNDKKMAYIFTAPKSYANAMRGILQKGLDRLEEIMSLPFYDAETGKVNTSVVAQVLKTFQLVDLRVKGAIVQKLQVDQRTVNVDVSQERMEQMQLQQLQSLSLDELESLDQKITRIEKVKAHQIENLPDHARTEVEILENGVSPPYQDVILRRHKDATAE